MNKSSNKFPIIFKALIFIQIIYLTISFFSKSLPGWKMFAYLERPQFILVNQNGVKVDHQKFLPSTVYALSNETILQLGKFICIKDNNHKLLLKFADGTIYNYEKPRCDYKKN